jgi:hypothetical protein
MASCPFTFAALFNLNKAGNAKENFIVRFDFNNHRHTAS